MNWQPYREPLRTTLIRTVLIAVVVGGIVAVSFGGGLSRWPVATLLVLWFSLGGHYVEVAFLNGLRPKLSDLRAVQVAARIAFWFFGGCILAQAVAVTATAIGVPRAAAWGRHWWVGGLVFIVVEFVAHVGLQLRRQPSFYNGRG